MSDFSDIALRRVSTAEAVAEVLTSRILSGALPSGEPLRESSLSAKLGVSRNSLREAIRLLERGRLVTYEVHRGAIVVTPTLDDLKDLYLTRRHLELAGIREKPTRSQLHVLTQAYEALVSATSLHEVEPIVTADLAFHQAIVDLIGSERMSSFYRQVSKELMFYFSVLSYADEEYVDPVVSIVDKHHGLYEALMAGDRDLAHDRLASHIDQNYERLKEILTSRQAAPQA